MATRQSGGATGAATAEKKPRERFKGLVVKNTPTKTDADAKAKIIVVNGTDVDRVVDDIRKGIAQATKDKPDIKFAKGTITLS